MKTPDDPPSLPLTGRHSSPADIRRGLVVMTISLLAFTANTLLMKDGPYNGAPDLAAEGDKVTVSVLQNVFYKKQ